MKNVVVFFDAIFRRKSEYENSTSQSIVKIIFQNLVLCVYHFYIHEYSIQCQKVEREREAWREIGEDGESVHSFGQTKEVGNSDISNTGEISATTTTRKRWFAVPDHTHQGTFLFNPRFGRHNHHPRRS